MTSFDIETGILIGSAARAREVADGVHLLSQPGGRDMSIELEINLRIPRMKVPLPDGNGYPIDNSTIRLTTRIAVPAIPKPGALLLLTTSSSVTFQGEVTRADWNEERSIFVLSCKYAERSIPPDICAALFNDLNWQVKPLV